MSIGGGFTRPDGVVSKEFRPALVRAEGGSRLGPWLRVERALSGWPAYASGRRPWPRGAGPYGGRVQASCPRSWRL